MTKKTTPIKFKSDNVISKEVIEARIKDYIADHLSGWTLEANGYGWFLYNEDFYNYHTIRLVHKTDHLIGNDKIKIETRGARFIQANEKNVDKLLEKIVEKVAEWKAHIEKKEEAARPIEEEAETAIEETIPEALKVKLVDNLAEALTAASTEERTKHNDAKLYNVADYESKMNDTIGRSKEILVIDGKIYYTFELPGEEKGMLLLNRLETLGAMMHNAPFYRVTLTSVEGVTDSLDLSAETRRISRSLETEDNLEAVPFSRELKARREYARRGWMMTTEINVINAYLDAIATDGGDDDDTPPDYSKHGRASSGSMPLGALTTPAIKLAGTFGKYAGIETLRDAKKELHKKDKEIADLKTDPTERYTDTLKDMTDVELLKEMDVWEDRVAYRPARITNEVLISILGEIGKRKLQRKTPSGLTDEQLEYARVTGAKIATLEDTLIGIRLRLDHYHPGEVAKIRADITDALAFSGREEGSR